MAVGPQSHLLPQASLTWDSPLPNSASCCLGVMPETTSWHSPPLAPNLSILSLPSIGSMVLPKLYTPSFILLFWSRLTLFLGCRYPNSNRAPGQQISLCPLLGMDLSEGMTYTMHIATIIIHHFKVAVLLYPPSLPNT